MLKQIYKSIVETEFLLFEIPVFLANSPFPLSISLFGYTVAAIPSLHSLTLLVVLVIY